MLGQPAVVARHDRGDAQRKAFLPQQGVAAIARAVGPDLAVLGKMDDVLAIRITGPRHVRLAIGQRHPNRMDTRHEGAVGAESSRAPAHPGHDPHRRGHIGRVGQLHSDVGDRAAERSHREGDHIHRASTHGPRVELSQLEAHLGGVVPVVGGPGILGVLTADEGAILDPCHVTGVRATQVAAGASLSVQRDQRAASTSRRHSFVYSWAEPSHQCRALGCMSSAHAWTTRTGALWGTSSLTSVLLVFLMTARR